MFCHTSVYNFEFFLQFSTIFSCTTHPIFSHTYLHPKTPKWIFLLMPSLCCSKCGSANSLWIFSARTTRPSWGGRLKLGEKSDIDRGAHFLIRLSLSVEYRGLQSPLIIISACFARSTDMFQHLADVKFSCRAFLPRKSMFRHFFAAL